MSLIAFPVGAGAPPVAGGFYRYPRSSRSLPSIDMPPTTCMLMDFKEVKASNKIMDLRRLAASQHSVRSYDPIQDSKSLKIKKSIRVKNNFNASNSMAESTSIDDTLFAPSLVSQYTKCIDKKNSYIPEDQRYLHKSSQSSLNNLIRLDFPEFKQYNEWMNGTVDPFIKNLRKVIVAQKPEDIREYVIQFCLSQLRDGSIPETTDAYRLVEEPKPEENSVNIANAAVHIQNLDVKSILLNVTSTTRPQPVDAASLED